MRTLLVVVVLAGALPASAIVNVTTCGQVVRGVGVLTADLDCSAQADDAVKLSGKLLLGGFTITGNPGFDVVRCETGGCKVVGPGTLTGGADAIRSDKRATADAVTITANGGDGVRTDGSAKVRSATVTSNGGDGVRAKGSAKIEASDVSGNGSDGVRADKTIVVKGSTVTANGGNGVDSDTKAKVQATSTVGGNGLDGVRGVRVSLKDSVATGNGVSPVCGVTDDCADLAAELGARVIGTATCGTSRRTEGGGTWGVCAND